jgi:hypothetical protein
VIDPNLGETRFASCRVEYLVETNGDRFPVDCAPKNRPASPKSMLAAGTWSLHEIPDTHTKLTVLFARNEWMNMHLRLDLFSGMCQLVLVHGASRKGKNQ